MQLELRRLLGQPVHEELWRSASDIPLADLDECVKDVLMSFYDGDEQEFWPKGTIQRVGTGSRTHRRH